MKAEIMDQNKEGQILKIKIYKPTDIYFFTGHLPGVPSLCKIQTF